MPTPRLIGEVMRTARRPSGGSSQQAPSGNWVEGVVQSSGGAINAVFQVSLSTGGVVSATSSLDFPVVAGSLVWVTRGGGGQHLIVGTR